jgi:hypothetical protein
VRVARIGNDAVNWLFPCCQPTPDIGTEYRDVLIGQLLRIFGIQILRPVDSISCVPLQVLAFLVELAQ